MTKSNYNGYISVTGTQGAPFVSAGTAILAAQALQFVVATQGYSTYLDIVLSNGRIELRAHLKGVYLPAIPQAYTYTQRELTSQKAYDETTHTPYLLRCVTWIFKYNEK